MAEKKAFTRPIYQTLHGRILEARRFLQVLVGPRQTGKTTLARQLLTRLDKIRSASGSNGDGAAHVSG